MALPKYLEYYPSILKYGDEEKSTKEYLSLIIKDMNISEEDQLIQNQNGEPTYRNRFGWAMFYLLGAKLMERPSRGKYVITKRGKTVREKGLDINNDSLKEFPEFREFIKPQSKDVTDSKNETEDLTPTENLELIAETITNDLKIELRNRIFDLSPWFFEELVVDLLRKMGYGNYQGTRATSRTGDGGIDGIVYQDELGLDIVYIQAKRYKEEHKIGTPDLQTFIGALDTRQASKGIFFTTSDFAATVPKFLETSTKKIVTVNGEQLLDLLIKNKVGVKVETSYNIYKIQEDYFSEE